MNQLEQLRVSAVALLAVVTTLLLGGCTRNDPATTLAQAENAVSTQAAPEQRSTPAAATTATEKNPDVEIAADPKTSDPNAAAALESDAGPGDGDDGPVVAPEVAEEVDYLLDTLKASDSRIQEQALEKLIEFAPAASKGVPLLMELFEEGKTLWTRRNAGRVLGAVGESARVAIPNLVKALADPEEFIRKGAIEGLLPLVDARDSELIPVLATALGDTTFLVQDRAGQALAKIGPKSLDALAEALRSSNPKAREMASRSLSYFGKDAFQALPELIEVLSDDEWLVRYRATRVLGMLGPDAQPASDALFAQIGHPQWQVRKATINALGDIDPTAKTLDPLLEQLQTEDRHGSVRSAAKVTLAKIRGEPVPYPKVHPKASTPEPKPEPKKE